jgi:hypothetical protein
MSAIELSKKPFAFSLEVFQRELEGVEAHERWEPPVFHLGSDARAYLVAEPEQPELTPALYLIETKKKLASDALLAEPAIFLRNANFGDQLGVWNSQGDARYLGIASGGFVAQLELARDDADDAANVVLGVWPVDEGLAVALLPGDARDILKAMLGVTRWPAGWQTASVSYGE